MKFLYKLIKKKKIKIERSNHSRPFGYRRYRVRTMQHRGEMLIRLFNSTRFHAPPFRFFYISEEIDEDASGFSSLPLFDPITRFFSGSRRFSIQSQRSGNSPNPRSVSCGLCFRFRAFFFPIVIEGI